VFALLISKLVFKVPVKFFGLISFFNINHSPVCQTLQHSIQSFDISFVEMAPTHHCFLTKLLSAFEFSEDYEAEGVNWVVEEISYLIISAVETEHMVHLFPTSIIES
jgi:hypothetical protein